MVGKTALNKEMKHLNGAYFRTNNITLRGDFGRRWRRFAVRLEMGTRPERR